MFSTAEYVTKTKNLCICKCFLQKAVYIYHIKRLDLYQKIYIRKDVFTSYQYRVSQTES